jgi:hypothetical protein
LEQELGRDAEEGLRWLTSTPDPVVCSMLTAGPLPFTAIVAAWREALARAETDEQVPNEADLHASLQRLTGRGLVTRAGADYELTASGRELATSIQHLYGALERAPDAKRRGDA